MTVNDKKNQKTGFRDNQDSVPEGNLPEGNLPGNREDRSDKMGTLNSEEIGFDNAGAIYDEYQ